MGAGNQAVHQPGGFLVFQGEALVQVGEGRFVISISHRQSGQTLVLPLQGRRIVDLIGGEVGFDICPHGPAQIGENFGVIKHFGNRALQRVGMDRQVVQAVDRDFLRSGHCGRRFFGDDRQVLTAAAAAGQKQGEQDKKQHVARKVVHQGPLKGVDWLNIPGRILTVSSGNGSRLRRDFLWGGPPGLCPSG